MISAKERFENLDHCRRTIPFHDYLSFCQSWTSEGVAVGVGVGVAVGVGVDVAVAVAVAVGVAVGVGVGVGSPRKFIMLVMTLARFVES